VRNYNDYITAYLNYSSHSEPPINFHVWTCISIIGAALQRKVYLPWGYNTLYPNMYIILIGPSGCGKGIAMGIGKRILKEVNGIVVCSASITREALIRDMRENVLSYVCPSDGQTKYHSSISVFSSELAVFLGQANIKFLADLTDWFDCHDSWEYRTKHQGTDELIGLCVNMLGATAPDWLRSIFPQEAFGGGFTSRVIFVVEEGKRQLISRNILPPDIASMNRLLVQDLERIHLLKGPMKFPAETFELFDKWYHSQAKKPPITDSHFSGYCERRAMHTLKLSMICSVSRGDDLIITPGDFERAIMLIESVEPRMSRAFQGLGRAKYAELTHDVFQYIYHHKEVSKASLLNHFDTDLDDYSLGIISKTLAGRGTIEINYNQLSGEVIYKLKGD